MKTLTDSFAPYRWAPSTGEQAARAGLDPVQIVRFDGNVPARPPASARAGTVAAALADVNEYAHGGYPGLVRAIATYAEVEPENVVLGAGADDLILLCARALAGPGGSIAIAEEPTYPLDRVRTWAGEHGMKVGPLPEARPLVVDEAYCEYAGETAAGLIDDGVIVLRTFSKAFGLAGARVGYALATRIRRRS